MSAGPGGGSVRDRMSARPESGLRDRIGPADAEEGTA